jgi:hypothetical protein
MPVEGLPTDNGIAQGGEGANKTAASTAATPDAAENNTGANAQSGADTDTAQNTQAQQTKEKTFTQADVDRIVQNRLKSAVKAELKKLTGDGDVTVDDLQRQLSEERQKTRGIEARESVRDYLSDPKHKLNVNPANVRAIEKLVMPDVEFDDAGKPTNIKDAIENAKTIAPALFANNQSNINANNGRGSNAGPTDMNQWVRSLAS